MKKILLTLVVVLAVCVSIFAMVACSAKITVMAEAGSAGEDFAKDFVKKTSGTKFVSAQAQKDILTELIAQTADIGIIDSIMANYYINTEGSTFAGKLEVVAVDAESETYAIGFRKNDVYLTQKVNKALYDLQQEGKIAEIATKYGLNSELVAFAEPTVDETLDKSSFEYVTGRGKMIIGYTLFAPIAYEDENNNLIGFDTDVAKAVCTKLGITAEFQEIDWNTKEVELNAKNIDAIWNGMTLTEERQASMSMSASYLKNTQVAVVRKGESSLVK